MPSTSDTRLGRRGFAVLTLAAGTTLATTSCTDEVAPASRASVAPDPDDLQLHTRLVAELTALAQVVPQTGPLRVLVDAYVSALAGVAALPSPVPENSRSARPAGTALIGRRVRRTVGQAQQTALAARSGEFAAVAAGMAAGLTQYLTAQERR